MFKSRKPRGLRIHTKPIAHTLRPFLRLLAKLRIVRVEVTDRENVPRKGRVIVAANHVSFADPVYLWGAMPRNGIAVAKAELWRVPGLGLLLWLMGHISIRRGDPVSAQNTLDAGEHILVNNGLLFIFPEGKCSKTGKLLKFKHGMVTMSRRTGSPILPVGLIGTDRVAPLGKWKIRWWKKVTVKFGTLVYPGDFTGPNAEAEQSAAVRKQILELTGQTEELAA